MKKPRFAGLLLFIKRLQIIFGEESLFNYGLSAFESNELAESISIFGFLAPIVGVAKPRPWELAYIIGVVELVGEPTLIFLALILSELKLHWLCDVGDISRAFHVARIKP